MTSANNAQKTRDPEKAALSATTSAAHLESQILHRQPEKSRLNNMKKIQHFGFSLLLLTLLAITIAAASKSSPRNVPAMSAEERIKLQELLNTIEPASLHELLHKHLKDKYQHGVYQEDKAAMEVVAQSNKDVAHSLIELAKRQAPNTTTTVIEVVTTMTTDLSGSTTVVATTTDVGTTAVAPPTTAVVPPTTSATEVTPPTTSPPPNQDTTTSTQDTQQTTAETNPTTSAQNSVSTTATGTKGAGGGTATETSLSTAVVTKTGNSQTTSGSSTNDKSSSKGSSPTSGSSVTQETIYTTTRPDGSVATVTSVTVVPAGQADLTGTSGATKTNGNPSLQTNGATAMVVGWNGVVGILGVVAVGVL